MPLATLDELVHKLSRLRLLEPAQLADLPGLRQQFPDPRSLARELLRRDWLTAYQANLLLQGQGDELVLGSYVLLERLGEGGMGAVFKARHQLHGRVVALKLIRPERLTSAEAVKRFHREVRTAAQLHHPNIVLALDADEVNGTHFFTMEYVRGTDLSRLVKQQGPLPVAAACDCIRQAALGLQHAHERGLVHRDIKPHNLLLATGGREPAGGVVKILDLGLARSLAAVDPNDDSSSALTGTGVIMGTPDYMAPEQCMDAHEVDIRADLYSLGCTLYFLLTGKVPFPTRNRMEKLIKHRLEEPPPIEQFRPDTPPAVAAVVRKLMAKKPTDRYQAPAELAAALEQLAAGTPLATAVQTSRPPIAPGAVPDRTHWSDVVASDTLGPQETPSSKRLLDTPPWRWWHLAIPGAVMLIALALILPRSAGSRKAAVVPATPSPPPAAAPSDWVELFTGKSLKGWAPYPAHHTGRWRFENGALVGVGPSSYLVSEVDDLDNFELHVEGRISPEGDGGVIFRSGLLDGNFTPGYEAQIADDTIGFKTGSLVGFPPAAYRPVGSRPFALDIKADGPEVTIKVNGKETGTWRDPRYTRWTGRVALQAWKQLTEVRFTQVRYRRLKMSDPSQAPRRLYRFRPDDPALIQAGVRTEGDSWRIDLPWQPGMLRPFTLRQTLYGGLLPPGRLVWRVEANQDAPVSGELGLWCYYPTFAPPPISGYRLSEPVGTWGAYELSALLSPNKSPAGVPIQPSEILAGCSWSSAGDARNRLGALLMAHDPLSGAIGTAWFLKPPTIRLRNLELWWLPWAFDEQLVQKHPDAPRELLIEGLGTLTGHTRGANWLSFAPGGQWLASGGADQTVQLWGRDADSWQLRQTLRGTDRGHRNPVAFAPDGQTLALARRDGTIELWNPAGSGWQLSQALPRHQHEVYSLAWSPDGTRLASSAHWYAEWDSGEVRLWNLTPGMEPTWVRLEDCRVRITDVAFSPDGQLLATAGGEPIASLWDARSGQRLSQLRGHSRSVTALAFAPDGILVTGDVAGVTRVWSRKDASWSVTKTLKGEPGGLRSAAFRPDGKVLVTGNSEGTVQVWDVESGEALAALRGHWTPVTALAFAPDGQTLASTGGNDGTVKLWRIRGK